MTRLLAIGDIHLGRQPSRLPPQLREQGLTPTVALERAVDRAIEEAVAAVLLAGDVVEQEDDLYEALGDLERAVRRLDEAGIPVFGVAGNHDTTVLPRLADAIPAFTLIGRGGEWETVAIADLTVSGWSFPQPTWPESPLATGPGKAPPGCPHLGLLHCDRDQSNSHYAPVSGRALADAPVNAWLLGHIHRPDDLTTTGRGGYLGSLMGLDPGEPGPHGPWMVEVAAEGTVGFRHLPIAPLRWEAVTVDLTELADPEAVPSALTTALDRLHDELAAAGPLPRAVGCRLWFTGRTAHAAAIQAELESGDLTGYRRERDGCEYFIEAWRMAARPALDLDELADGGDPVALLAARLRILEGPDTLERQALLAEAREELRPQWQAREFAGLDEDEPDDEELLAAAREAGLRALDELLRQREAS
ncbi:MAG: metallophosphoesterase family protein [Pseudomonadota bacterium]